MSSPELITRWSIPSARARSRTASRRVAWTSDGFSLMSATLFPTARASLAEHAVTRSTTSLGGTMTQGPLMVLDSAGLWFRAFHSVREKISGPDGTPANAERGFCDMVAVLGDAYGPSGLVAARDRNWRPAWRGDRPPAA